MQLLPIAFDANKGYISLSNLALGGTAAIPILAWRKPTNKKLKRRFGLLNLPSSSSTFSSADT